MKKKERITERIIKGTAIDVANVFKECFPYAVKGAEDAIEFLVDMEEPIAIHHF